MGANVPAANVLNILSTTLTLLDQGTTAYQLLTTAHNRVKAIVDQGRDPTPDEWDALDKEIASLHQQLQS